MFVKKEKIQCHLSIDDTYSVFNELYDEKYTSIWQHPFWCNLQKAHEKWGCLFTLYVFGGLENQSDLLRKDFIIRELQECSTWIKLAYHGSDSDDLAEFKENFCSTKRFLTQLFDEDVTAHIIRLHRFKATDDIVNYLKTEGVSCLLAADDSRLSYDLSEEQVQRLQNNGVVQNNNMIYLHTDIRLEKWIFLTQYYSWKKRGSRTLVLFTHECYMKKRNSFVMLKLKLILRIICRRYDVNYICK